MVSQPENQGAAVAVSGVSPCGGLEHLPPRSLRFYLKLRLAGLVRSRREGRRQVYFVDDPDIVTVVRLLVGRLTDRAEHVPARHLRGV